jgi:hypothetical protein
MESDERERRSIVTPAFMFAAPEKRVCPPLRMANLEEP